MIVTFAIKTIKKTYGNLNGEILNLISLQHELHKDHDDCARSSSTL